MNNFTYNMTTKILFGKSALSELPNEIKKVANRVLLVTGKGSVRKIGLFDEMTALLGEHKIAYAVLEGVDPNPRLSTAKDGIYLYKRFGAQAVLAVGGGSALDCAKLIAAGVCYDGDPWDLMEDFTKIKIAAPVFTVLTLAATGSEQNGNLVITNTDTHTKLGGGNPLMRPVCSVLDPTYTYTVNRFQTGAGGADIISHILEQYFNNVSGAYTTDRVAEGLLKTVITYAPVALKTPDDYEARANLMWTGSIAICGLLNAGKNSECWSCHSLEHPVSGVFDISHGAGLAVLTPVWLEYILEKSPSVAARIATLGYNVLGVTPSAEVFADAKSAITALRGVFAAFGMPDKLSALGVTVDGIPTMARMAYEDGLDGAYVPLTQKDAEEIYRRAL